MIQFDDIIVFPNGLANKPHHLAYIIQRETTSLFFWNQRFPDTGTKKNFQGERRKFISNGRYEDHSLEKDGFALTLGYLEGVSNPQVLRTYLEHHLISGSG